MALFGLRALGLDHEQIIVIKGLKIREKRFNDTDGGLLFYRPTSEFLEGLNERELQLLDQF